MLLQSNHRVGTDGILEELQRQIAELPKLLNSLSESVVATDFTAAAWREDCANQHEETPGTVRATAKEPAPFNLQGVGAEMSI